MRKTILIALLTLASISSFAQTRKDFINFIDTFNWSISESSFKAKYASRLVPETDSLFISLELPPTTYLLNDLRIGDYDCLTMISFQDENGMFIFSRLTNEVLESNRPSVLSAELDRIILQKMKEPDMKVSDIPLSSLGFEGAEAVIGEIRTWLTDTVTLLSFNGIAEDGLKYLIIARKGTPREPDFRKGKWGDSMAECKKKEGKADELGMEDIYAFDTYVAGIQALAAYRFTNDRLTSGKYVFMAENEDNCIRDYDKLVSYLTKKYGDPVNVSKEYTANDFEKSHYSDGYLVKTGKLEMSTTWYTPFSIISIFLNGERYSVSMALEYYSTKLDQVREEGILNDL